MDALVDLPFALPTAVAGLTLSALFAANGWLGQWFEAIGIPRGLHAAGHHDRDEFHQPAVRGARGTAGAGRPDARTWKKRPPPWAPRPWRRSSAW